MTHAQAPNLITQNGITPTTADVRTTPVSLVGVAKDVGYQLFVTAAGTGQIVSIMVETAVSDADNADSTQWTECPESEVVNFDLTTLGACIRIRVADPVLDKVRLRLRGNGSVGGGATLRCNWISSRALS